MEDQVDASVNIQPARQTDIHANNHSYESIGLPENTVKQVVIETRDSEVGRQVDKSAVFKIV